MNDMNDIVHRQTFVVASNLADSTCRKDMGSDFKEVLDLRIFPIAAHGELKFTGVLIRVRGSPCLNNQQLPTRRCGLQSGGEKTCRYSFSSS